MVRKYRDLLHLDVTVTKEPMRAETNLHDYLDRIGSKPPPVSKEDLAKAMEKMLVVGSVEEAAEVIIRLDQEETLEEPPRND